MFVIYVSDLSDWLKSSIAGTYADDTQTSTSSTDLSIIKKNLESDSIQVFEFMAFKYGRFAKFDKNVDFGKIAILSKKSGIFKY